MINYTNQWGRGKRAAVFALVAGAGALGSAAATQYIAARTGYATGLGSPLLTVADVPFYPPWKWFEWMQAPWAPDAYQTFVRVKLTAMGALVGTAVGLLLWRTRLSRRPKRYPELHGTARFALAPEIQRAGLFARHGVHLGGWRDRRRLRTLRQDGPEHVAIIAPTRSGKGTGVIVPTLLNWGASSIVYDEKGELAAITGGWQASIGTRVIRFQPGAASGCHRFNFLDAVRVGTAFEVADAQNIALLLVDRDGKGVDRDHWKSTAYQLLAGLILHTLHQDPGACLADVACELSMPGREPEDLFADMAASPYPFVAITGQACVSRHPKEQGSVTSTAAIALELFTDPLIAANTRRSDFAIGELMNDAAPAALYIVTPGADKLRLRPLVRLLLASAMRTLLGAEVRFEDGRPLPVHRHRLLMVLDEFPSLGRLDVIEDALPKCAGYGIKVLLVAQDRDQIVGAYGATESILANCHVRVCYAPNSVATAEWISKMAGEGTVVREVLSESGTRLGALSNVNRSLHESRRPLLTADEVMRLRMTGPEGPGELLLFVGGLHPIRGEQTPYYLDPELSRRASLAVPG